MIGRFELLVKIYDQGAMSQHLDGLKIGDSVEFKHIPFNVKVQYPFAPKVGMLVGGTGITPMIQALHAVLGNAEDDTKVSMLYGSQKSDQILAGEILARWQEDFPDRLSVTHVVSNEPEDSSWEGERGFITRDLIEKHLGFGPDDDASIFVG